MTVKKIYNFIRDDTFKDLTASTCEGNGTIVGGIRRGSFFEIGVMIAHFHSVGRVCKSIIERYRIDKG